MIHDVKQFFELEKEFRNADFMETDNYLHIYNDIVSSVKEGNLVAFTGIVGCGKTITIRRIRRDLKKKNEVLVSSSMSVEKHRIKSTTLISAILADIIGKKRKFLQRLKIVNGI